MKKLFLFLFCGALLAFGEYPKYVFLFIGDGMSIPQRQIAEEYSKRVFRQEISFNHFPHVGTTTTFAANAIVTDSAAAATAISCGSKTNVYRLGTGPDGHALESVAYVAKKTGRKVGIITSVTLNHATPGAFYAHRANRNDYYNVALDMVSSDFDFFGGGGIVTPDDKKNDNYHGDIYGLAVSNGYKVFRGEELRNARPGDGKVLAVGCPGSLPYALDRDAAIKIPRLDEYVDKAIEVLYNPRGFFIMVEGGIIDHAGHANDAATNINEVMGLDRAVRSALKFAEKHKNETLIVVTGDHETGGMSMGAPTSLKELRLELFAHQKCSVSTFANKVKEVNDKATSNNTFLLFEQVKPMLTEYFGFKFLAPHEVSDLPMVINEDELVQLNKAFVENKIADAARKIIQNKAGISWTTTGHTALPVLTTATGSGAQVFAGMYDNTDIAKKLKDILLQK